MSLHRTGNLIRKKKKHLTDSDDEHAELETPESESKKLGVKQLEVKTLD